MKNFFPLIFAFLFLPAVFSFAQTGGVQDLLKSGIEEHDKGNYEKAIEYYDKALEYEPDNEVLIYEKAWSYFAMKNYPEVISLLSGLVEKGQTKIPEVYSLLASAYDDSGKRDKSVEVFEKGVKRFPKFGLLYCNYGITLMRMDKPGEALDIFEKGIEKDPDVACNYYYAAKLFSQTEEEIWALIYGEIFINLEPATARTDEISKLLYDVYINSIKKDGNSYTISLSKAADPLNTKQFQANYEILSLIVIPGAMEDGITLSSIVEYRNEFLKLWKSRADKIERSNIVFERQEQILKADEDFLECYNYFLLTSGDNDAFNVWFEKNKDDFTKFAKWFNNHPLKFSTLSYYYREQY